MKTLKAGCILVDEKSGKVALIYREKRNDYSFPKGHLEGNETIVECAIRETAEETKRVAKILDKAPYIDEYVTPLGEVCACYTFLAVDQGKSDNSSTDTHETLWLLPEEVSEKLTYDSLRKTWEYFKDDVLNLLEKGR